MVSIVIPTFKIIKRPVRRQITAKQTDQEINSLIFNLFEWLVESGTGEIMVFKPEVEMLTLLACSRTVCI